MRVKLATVALSILVISTMSACNTNTSSNSVHVHVSNNIENISTVEPERNDDKATINMTSSTNEEKTTEPIEKSENYTTESERKYGESCQEPFYGIWCIASKELSDAETFVKETLMKKGIEGAIFVTTDWENLNTEKWYVVTAGIYGSKEAAQNKLEAVQRIYADAYVKYSGEYIGNGRIYYTIWDLEQIINGDNYFELNACIDGKKDNRMLLRIDQNTEFASSCDMEFINNYEVGDTVYDWYRRNYLLTTDGMPAMEVLGVFDVSVTGNHIDKLYGVYWWD